MTDEFNKWWQGDYDDTDNPYRVDSPAYWAYAGWQAREAEIIRLIKLLTKMPDEKPWVGLTDDEIQQCIDSRGGFVEDFARAIQAKLKEKNNINTFAPEDSMHINTLGKNT